LRKGEKPEKNSAVVLRKGEKPEKNSVVFAALAARNLNQAQK
jgi:hypothetical protein